MEKVLNILSFVIKLATVGLGGLGVADIPLLHLDVGTLGKVVSGLGTAALVVKGLQIKVQPPTFNK